MARYKVNVLHMHLTDDYGWRIEIADIPELTDFGARSQIPQPDGKGWYKEDGAIMSSSVLDKNDKSEGGNRYYSREDYIALVKYCAERKIRVLPEIDFPGHSRAVVESLRAYERRTGDTRYRPTHPEDKSVFASVQGVSDNTFDIVNRQYGSYLSPVATFNTQITTTKSKPANGWTISYANTPTYYIISSGEVQLNQTGSGQSYKIPGLLPRGGRGYERTLKCR